MNDRRRTALDRATAKAHEQARAGNLPTVIVARAWSNGITTWRYALGSRTAGGTVYLIDLTDSNGRLTTHCDCPAMTTCWHRVAVRLAHTGIISKFYAGLEPRELRAASDDR
jgi:hypothetical protein